MALYTLSPCGYFTIEDTNGAAIALGQVRTRVAGLATLADTWLDSAGVSLNTNPIVADGSGRFVAFLQPGVTYDFDYMTASGSIFKTVTGIAAVPSSSSTLDETGTAGESVLAGQVGYLSDGSGSKTAGQWYLGDADFPYASTLPVIGIFVNDLTSLASGSIRTGGRITGLTGLTIGWYYVSATAGGLTATAPVNARVVGFADSTSSLIVMANPPPVRASVDIPGTAGEALAAGEGVYLSDGSGALTAGRWYKWDADFLYASAQPIVGMVPAAIASAASGTIRVGGRVPGLTGLTAGLTYYVSATAGALTATAPVNRRVVGVADSTTSLILGTDRPKVELLGAISGTTQAAAASSVSIASLPSGTLTAKDRIVLEYTIESITQLTAASGFYNNTDAVLMARFNGGNAIQVADTIVVGRYTIQQAQNAATRIISHDLGTPIGSSPNGTVAESAISTFTQNWTGAWELALRIGAVTAGGTCRYSVLALIERGQ